MLTEKEFQVLVSVLQRAPLTIAEQLILETILKKIAPEESGVS